MSGWTSVDTPLTQGCTFQRPLDALEACFVWTGLFDGTSDSLYHYELHLSNGSRNAQLFSDDNIVQAWISTKWRFPLAGATVRSADGAPLRVDPEVSTDSLTGNVDIGAGFTSAPHFIVREHDLAVLRPGEIVFGRVSGAEDAQRQAAGIAYGPRALSVEMLVRLCVFRETDSEVLHLMVLTTHCVTDGTASRTLVRCFLDTLARGGEDESARLAQVPLEKRLGMMVPPGELDPVGLRALSPARRRWRRAVGTVIFRLRVAKMKGGHTLPCRLTRRTPEVPGRPGLVSTSLTPMQTATVLANCRLHDLTFGSAFPVIAQVAMTRVLCRRYLRGEISEEEWSYRKRQPHINGGPLNLRRCLDKAWFDMGGGGEFILCISLFIYQLPFMTLGAGGAAAEGDARIASDGAPPFADLLTFDRFLHRARLVKEQAKAFFGHPLFLEILHAMHMGYLQHTRLHTLRWMQRTQTANGHDTRDEDEDEDEVLAVTDIPTIWAHGGSSLGNVDLISPREYPLPPTHPLSPYAPTSHPVKAGYVTLPTPPLPSSETEAKGDTTPKIVVENVSVYLHARPAELYLGAATWHGRMNVYVHYDGNVFEEAVVREWLDEVREAVVWYLGRTLE